MNKLVIANIIILLSLIIATSLFGPSILHAFIGILPKNLTLVTLAPEAGLVMIFVISIVLSLIIYMPIGMISLYYSVKPALYENEKKFFRNNILFGIVMFLVGAAFGTFSFLTFGIPFYIWIDKLIGLPNFWSLPSLVYQSLTAALSIGIAFLFPIVLNNLIHYNFITVDALKKRRAMFAFALAIIIIVLPWLPNNPIEQLAVGLPIYGLFEATIWFNSRKKTEQVNVMVA
jgi:sec-independent protein translocase protein TatC